MKLSVIIPVFNGAKTIESTVAGIPRPAFPYEILVVDDGSTDGTREILSGLAKKDPCLRVIVQENAGPAAARNRALGEAAGEYVTFCDADDAFLPGMPEAAVAEAEKRGADLLLAGFLLTEPGKPGAPYTYRDLDARGISEHLGELYRANMLNQAWAKVFRRDLIRDLSFPDRKWGEDRLFLFSALARAKTPALWSQPVYEYRQQPGSLISRFLSDKCEICREVDDAFRALAKELNAPACREAADYMLVKSLWSAFTTLFSPSCPLSAGEKKDYVRAALAEERGQERRFPADCGRAFKILAKTLASGDTAAVCRTARLVALASRVMPSAARRAKHAYNR